jgi:hypothetical protein
VVTCTTHKVLRGPRGGMILCRAELAQRVDKAVFPFSQGGPMMHAIAAKAVALREASGPAFHAYARQVVDNARALAVALATEGMRPVAGGTDTHLVLADVREIGITGRDAEARCDLARITLNKNAIPFDPQRPAVASRHPGGLAGGDHPGDAGGRDAADRPADRGRGAQRPGNAGGGVPPGRRSGRGAGADREVPGLRAAGSDGMTEVEEAQTTPADPRWRVAHLPFLTAVSAALLLCAASAGYFAGGSASALGAALGVLIVTMSYTMSTLVVAWADTVRPALILPLALATYVLKYSLLGVVLVYGLSTDWTGKQALGWAIAAAVLVWTGVQAWWFTALRPPK